MVSLPKDSVTKHVSNTSLIPQGLTQSIPGSVYHPMQSTSPELWVFIFVFCEMAAFLSIVRPEVDEFKEGWMSKHLRVSSIVFGPLCACKCWRNFSTLLSTQLFTSCANSDASILRSIFFNIVGYQTWKETFRATITIGHRVSQFHHAVTK